MEDTTFTAVAALGDVMPLAPQKPGSISEKGELSMLSPEFVPQRGVSVRTIEPLPEGEIHVLCATGDGADEIRLTLASHIITRSAGRLPLYRG